MIFRLHNILAGLLILLFCGLGSQAFSLTAEEILSDPVLETRARALSQQLRCLVCQNQSIDDSDATLAKDLRRIVREQLKDGRSDTEILDFLQETYGDYVLLKPPHAVHTWLLWYGPFAIVLMALFLLFLSRRKRRQNAIPTLKRLPSDQPVIVGTHRPFFTIGLMFFIVSGFSFATYQFLGRPDLAPKPLAERTEEIRLRLEQKNTQESQQQKALQLARNRATLYPNDPEALLELGLAAGAVGKFDEAIIAIEAAVALEDNNTLRLHLLEAHLNAADGQMTVKARRILDGVLAAEPQNPFALYYQGLTQYQDELYSLALDSWLKVLRVSASDAPWRPRIIALIQNAAELGELAVPELGNGIGDKEILAMVEGLARRLEANPEDPEGWQRLGQAYDVLSRPEDAEKAYFRASENAVDQPSVHIHYLEWLLAKGLSKRYLNRAQTALEHLQQASDYKIEFLFFSGHLAKLRGETEDMKNHWQTLLELVPEDSEFAATLRQHLQAE